jgi:hypothetical protein
MFLRVWHLKSPLIFSGLFSTFSQQAISLEPISKIVDHAQEQGVSRRKSAAYIAQYVSILRRLTTKLLGVRCIFEIGS